MNALYASPAISRRYHNRLANSSISSAPSHSAKKTAVKSAHSFTLADLNFKIDNFASISLSSLTSISPFKSQRQHSSENNALADPEVHVSKRVNPLGFSSPSPSDAVPSPSFIGEPQHNSAVFSSSVSYRKTNSFSPSVVRPQYSTGGFL